MGRGFFVIGAIPISAATAIEIAGFSAARGYGPSPLSLQVAEAAGPGNTGRQVARTGRITWRRRDWFTFSLPLLLPSERSELTEKSRLAAGVLLRTTAIVGVSASLICTLGMYLVRCPLLLLSRLLAAALLLARLLSGALLSLLTRFDLLLLVIHGSILGLVRQNQLARAGCVPPKTGVRYDVQRPISGTDLAFVPE